jgi:uncharacterized spore protein YtfJ
MDSYLNEVISKLTDFLKDEAKTETVIGQQFQLGEFQCVPVIGVGFGLGVGGGEGSNPKQALGTGMGGGAGIGMGPLGFLVTKGTEIQFISTRQTKGLTAVFEKLPDVLESYFNRNKSEKSDAKVTA